MSTRDMQKRISNNFMGVRPSKLEDAKVIVLPVPYEATVTYVAGTGKGPQAIIDASNHVELYDDELDCEPYVWGIHTLPALDVSNEEPELMVRKVSEEVYKIPSEDKLVIFLGGEHSITPAIVSAFVSKYKDLSVLQLDAHADLRESYEGTKYNHACAMRRVLEYCPIVQVGIRSLSLPERLFIDQGDLNVIFMKDMRSGENWISKVVGSLSGNVYITIDLDVLDPSIMPSVGTPEPGGMLWNEIIELIKEVSKCCSIVGVDVVELSPQQGNVAPDFLTAKLIYKLIGYVSQKWRRTNSEGNLYLNHPNTEVNVLHVFQLTDSATRFKCMMKIDPTSFSSYYELFERYVKTIDDSIMTEQSAKYLSSIQDCIYKIDDQGNLTDLYEGIIIRQGDDIVHLGERPKYQLVQTSDGDTIMMLDIVIDRSQITESANFYGYNIRKWKKNRQSFEAFVHQCLERQYGSEADAILKLSTAEGKKRFIWAVAKRIWESDFELYSRFIGDKIWFKDPAETLKNIIEGRGGNCAEKASAMKLVTDAYGLKSEYLLAGPNAKGPFPEGPLRGMLETFDFELGRKYMIYWQHVALLYNVDGEDILVDVANGNIPFLFLTGEQVEELLRPYDKKGIKVEMVNKEETFYYHLPPQDIPENLISAMQDWIKDIDLIHVFDDGLGLLITSEYYVWPVMYRDEDEKMMEYQWWEEEKEKRGFKDIELLDNFSLPGKLVSEFQERYPQKFVDIVTASEHLAKRYNESYRESPDEPRYNVAFLFVKLR